MYWRPLKSAKKWTMAATAAVVLLTATGHAQTDPANALAHEQSPLLLPGGKTATLGITVLAIHGDGTVTGLAPFVSYLRTLRRDYGNDSFPTGHKLFLLNGASRSWEFGYHEEILRILEQSPWLQYVPTISRPWEDEKWEGEVGRVDDLVRKYVDLWGLTAQNTTAYVCGHPEMIEHTKGILRRRGFPKENLKEEIYWIPAKKVAAT